MRQDSQNLANDILYRPLVTSAQCIIGTEKYPDCSILKIYNDDDYSQGYGLLKEAFETSTKDDVLEQYIKVKMILDRLMMLIILAIIYTFSTYDIRKILNPLNQKSRIYF